MFDQGDVKEKYRVDWEPRYLAYIFIDGELLQDILVKEGLARVAYVQEPNTTYLNLLENSEASAKMNMVGIWSIENYVLENTYNQQ